MDSVGPAIASEDAREGKPLVTARVEAEHVAPGAVKPRHDYDLVADGDSIESFCERRTDQPV